MSRARAATPVAVPDDLIPAPLQLVGLDGGAGHIIAAVSDALRSAGNPRSVIAAWRMEAISGDYAHLLRAAMSYTYDPETES